MIFTKHSEALMLTDTKEKKRQIDSLQICLKLFLRREIRPTDTLHAFLIQMPTMDLGYLHLWTASVFYRLTVSS